MQLINAPGKLVLPFANAGAKNAIPVASQIGIVAGAASLTDGFPPLTRTPLAAGGTPPSGLDMNGIIYELSAILRWANAGGGYIYDGTFASDGNINGYPKGARVLRSDGSGYWLNTIDGNTVNPESTTAGQAATAGWVPDLTNGIAAVTMTSSNVTLTPLQYGMPIVVLSGVLTANLNLIFPNIAGEWTVVNNCTGAYAVTAKTAAGTGVTLASGGRKRVIYGDGTNIYNATDSADTPAQFDASTSIATMAAVQRALGNCQGVVGMGANLTLTQAQVGSLIEATGAGGYTLTLCSTTGIGGTAFPIYNKCSSAITVSAAAGQNINIGTSNVTSFSIPSGGTAWLITDGVSWETIAGTVMNLGGNQTWQNVTGSRAFGTTYTNTTGRPILVSVYWYSSAVAQGIATVGGQNADNSANNSAGYGTGRFVVPPGATYSFSINTGTTSLGSWNELR